MGKPDDEDDDYLPLRDDPSKEARSTVNVWLLIGVGITSIGLIWLRLAPPPPAFKVIPSAGFGVVGGGCETCSTDPPDGLYVRYTLNPDHPQRMSESDTNIVDAALYVGAMASGEKLPTAVWLELSSSGFDVVPSKPLYAKLPESTVIHPRWTITPKKAGTNVLMFRVLRDAEGNQAPLDIQSYPVEVITNAGMSVKWTALLIVLGAILTTLLGVGGTLLADRLKSKKPNP